MFFFAFRFVLIFSCIQLFIRANEGEEIEMAESVATTEGLPSSIVNQSVCAITGEYIDTSVDLILPGPEPLIIYRSYSSMDPEGHLGRHWHFNHRGTSSLTSQHFGEAATLYCSINQPSGARLQYTRNLMAKKLPDVVSFQLKLPKGLTNCASGEISGRTNIKNQEAFYFSEAERLEIRSGAGALFTFEKLKKEETHNHTLFQISERKSNGNGLLYTPVKNKGYTALNKIQALNFASNQIYSWVKLERGEKDKYGLPPPKFLKASDERTVKYKYFEHVYSTKIKNGEECIKIDRLDSYLTDVESSFFPHESFEYCPKQDHELFQICCKKRPDNRFLKTEYYHVGQNHLGKEIITVNDKYDYRVDRVKLQKAPVGHDKTPIVTHRFIYKANTKPRKHAPEEVLDGYTDVLDAYFHKISYSYTKDHRLTAIKRYLGNENYFLYRSEKYVWGDKETSNEGNLMGKYLLDHTGRIYSGRYFTYDEYGNIITDCLYGQLTGKGSPDLALDAKQMPIYNGCECYQKGFRYSEDGLNLLISEYETNGKAIHYFYKPGTDLLTAKLVFWQNQLCIRHFYFYDQNAILIRSVTDDGSFPDYHDLTHVTERRITQIVPTDKMPFGLPAQMDEMYLDLSTGQEILLKRLLCTYSPEGKILKQDIYDSQGAYCYSLSYEYDPHGNVTKEVNALGEMIVKTYDENNNLLSKQGPCFDYCTRYVYDFCNRLIREEEIPSNLDSNKPWFVTTHRYDYVGNRIATVNPYGQEVLYQYDDLGRLILTIYPAVANELGEIVQAKKAREYDVADRITGLIDAKGQRTSKVYNVRGQPTYIVYPDGTQERLIYELDGKLAAKIEKNGTITCYTRDYQGRVIKEEIYTSDYQLLKTSTFNYNAFHLISSHDVEGNVTAYRYDYAGRLISTIKGNQVQTQAYDTLGRVVEIREKMSIETDRARVTKKTYDFLDRLIKEQIEESEGTLLHLSSYVYDCQGNRIQLQEGQTCQYIEYNAFKQPVKIIDALGQATHIVYDHNFINSYGQRVLLILVTDPLGNQTVLIHDIANRVVQTIKRNAFNIDLACQQAYYDVCGNKTRVVDIVMHEGKALRQIQTVWHYNVNHQVVALVEAAFAPEQKITYCIYNAYGQKAEEIHPNGTHLVYEYDPIGRLRAFKTSDSSIHYLYEYNRKDQPTKAIDLVNGFVNELSYNAMGKLSQEKLGNGLTVVYNYDCLERLRAVVFPDQTGIEYVYNALDLKAVHRWKDGKIAYSHCDVSHNLSGQIMYSQLIGQAGQIQYQYDLLGRLIDIRSSCTAQAIPSGGYDAAGNLRMYWDQATLYQFGYDDLYQLKSEKGAIEHTYQCDSLSNRLVKDNQPYQVNVLNQLLSQTNTKYTYDLNGNLIQKANENETTTYTYDALNRLVSVSSNGVVTAYIYDSFNRRIIRRQAGAVDQNFLYQGQEEVGIFENGVLKQLKVLGNGTQVKAIAFELDQQTYVPFYDLFGHIKCVSDLNGQTVEHYSYSAFGEEKILDPAGQILPESAIGNPWRYAGKRVDEETGLIAFGLRYYDPVTGRWITTDPIGFEDGPNLYAYLHHNPFAYFDAFGLFSESASMSHGWGFEAGYERDHYKHLENLDLSPEGSLFPKSFYTEFSQSYNLNRDLTHPDTGQPFNFPDLPPNRLVTCSNGIMNTKEEFTRNMMYLAQTLGCNVQGVHCATFGLCNDIIGYLGVRFLDRVPEAAQEIANNWKNCFATLSPDAIIEHHCHSRGVSYSGCALTLLPPELAKRIFLVATGPANFIPQDLCYGVVHICCNKDKVTFTDPIGRARAKREGTLVEINISEGPCDILDSLGLSSRTYAILGIPSHHSFLLDLRESLYYHSFTNPIYERYHKLYHQIYLKESLK